MAKPEKAEYTTPADAMSARLEGRAQVVRILNLSRGTGKAAGESNAILDDPFTDTGMYGSTQGPRRVLVPPMGEGSLRVLSDLVDESNILRQCLDAYLTNIDGFGHKLEAIDQDETTAGIQAAPEARDEYVALKEFFDYGYADDSFIELRKRIRRDQETTGCGYVEVLRDTATGLVNRLNHVPAYTVRQTVYDPTPVIVIEKRMVDLKVKEVKVSRRFRTYIQIQFGSGKKEMVWFKEFGDPRVLDKVTGKFLSGKGKPGENAASELWPFHSGYHPTSPYSTPRWIGNLPSVMGSRAAEEINLLYFDNKAIPPMVITVSGGALTKGTIKRIENLVNYKLKGRENFHEPLILEAQPVSNPDGTSGAPKVEIKPLTDAAIKDALFMGYDDGNRKKVRSSFRLTPMYTGESEDITRATGEASQLLVEEQVFRPERVGFDYKVNRWLLPELGAKYHRFVSLGPNVTLNEDLIAAMTAGETAGGMTPNIARKLLSDITESDIPQIDEDWGNQPFSLLLANVRATATAQAALLGGGGPGGAPGGGAAPPAPATLPAKFTRHLTDAAREFLKAEIVRELNRRKVGKA